MLKSLILENRSDSDAGLFQEFLLMHPNWVSELFQSHNESQISVLCPMLRTLLIQGFDLTQKRELIPGFKKVVILRAACGSPLKMFTLFDFALGSKIELIGSHGSFVMKNVALGRDAKPFRLDI